MRRDVGVTILVHGILRLRIDSGRLIATLKSLALEEIYADPHRLDGLIASGEPVQVMQEGRTVAELVPRKLTEKSKSAPSWPPIDFRARFLEMWGPKAFENQTPVSELFDQLRSSRDL